MNGWEREMKREIKLAVLLRGCFFLCWPSLSFGEFLPWRLSKLGRR